eukprot:3936704-Rhodomonas_salina.3
MSAKRSSVARPSGCEFRYANDSFSTSDGSCSSAALFDPTNCPRHSTEVVNHGQQRAPLEGGRGALGSCSPRTPQGPRGARPRTPPHSPPPCFESGRMPRGSAGARTRADSGRKKDSETPTRDFE